MSANAPNLYQLQGRTIHVSYSTSGIDGQPHFTYQDTTQTLSFRGQDIRVVESDLGQVVSVSLRRTIDSGSTSFSVIIPRVGLVDGHPANITTQGITTVHRFSVVPLFMRGQLDTYSYARLVGTASFVVF